METEREPVANPLDQWLQTLSTEGDVESEGDGFSIADEKAWEKLAAFQLPFESAWVLKLVQAAVVGGAQRIEVVQTRSQTSFSFPGAGEWKWEEIQRLLFQVDSTTDSAEAHLAVALRVLAKTIGHPFFLNLPGDCLVIWNGANFQTAASTEEQLEIRISHFVAARLLDAIRLMTSIQKALDDYCHLCSIPITIDKRKVNSVGTDPFLRPTGETVPLAFLQVEPSTQLPGFQLPETDWDSALPRGVRPAATGEQPFQSCEGHCGGALLIAGFRRPVLVAQSDNHFEMYIRPSEILWVSDGVIVSRESLGVNRTVAFLVIANAKYLETDLTGFQLLQNGSFQARRQEVLRATAEQISYLRQSGGITTKGRTSIKALLGWGGIALGLVLPPAGLAILTLRLFTKNAEHSAHAKRFDSDLREGHEQLLDLAARQYTP